LPSSSHVLFPAFVGATASTIPLHSVTLHFSRICVCHPLLIGRLLPVRSVRPERCSKATIYMFCNTPCYFRAMLSAHYATLLLTSFLRSSAFCVAGFLTLPQHRRLRSSFTKKGCIKVSTLHPFFVLCGAWGCSSKETSHNFKRK